MRDLELGDELTVIIRELDGIGVLDGVLILRARDAVFDGEVLRGLQEGLDAVDLIDAALQTLDDLLRGVLALVAVLQVDLNAAGVERGVGASMPMKLESDDDVRIFQEGVRKLLLARGHGVE